MGRRAARPVSRPVFVDRYGARRRLVIGVGLVLAVLLLAWLALVGVGMAVDGRPAGNAYTAGNVFPVGNALPARDGVPAGDCFPAGHALPVGGALPAGSNHEGR